MTQDSKTPSESSTTERKYDFQTVEARWRQQWESSGLFTAPDQPDPEREKFYMLVMFAYPSGDIHMGHFRNYIIGDAVARRQMMLGKQVMHPFGWDAFGLPAERAAIKRKLNPADWTRDNIKISRDTLKEVGISFDWSREVVTCQADYYRWSQWLFLRLFEKGLAYRQGGLVNWCPDCQTVLANEQVVNDACERCDTTVVKKELEQWYYRITDYADQLIDDLDQLPGWPENVKTMQREWIGRSYGAEIEFAVEGADWSIPVYTTRIDTIYGVSFVALAPESAYVSKLQMSADKAREVAAYAARGLRKTDIDRGSDTEEKDGVFTGLYASNPFSGERVQIWVGDYVLAHYGSGAVMGVPAHDTRDHGFAKRYDLPIKQVIKPTDGSSIDIAADISAEAFTEYGVLVDSAEFSGQDSKTAISKMAEKAKENGFGFPTKKFKLHDWLVSRQRYWGTPIPIIHCPNCGLVPVPDDQLPLKLPIISDFLPKGRSPLADCEEFMNSSCPKCGNDAQRDPDTMDTFTCSSWYHLRYADPHNDSEIFSSQKANAWLPVDKYIGGITHAIGHLIQFRFITKFLRDLGILDFGEPARELFNHGMVKDESGLIMSKSRGNVVSPIQLMKERGVDVTRLAMFFTAPSEREVIWSDAALVGVEKFLLNKLSAVGSFYQPTENNLKCHFKRSELDEPGWKLYVSLNQRIKRVADDSERLQFNTVIASMMELYRDLERSETSNIDLKNLVATSLIQMMAPLAPHICEELWAEIGYKTSVFLSHQPDYDPEALQDSLITIAVQINGKLRGEIEIDPGSAKDDILSLARSSERIVPYLQSKDVIKEIYVPGRLINFVVR